MARFDNSYSRFVAWLKIILPLLALAILSTMFLISRTVDPSQTIPFAEVDPKELASDQRISGPNYSGVTRDGSAISLSAETARPIGTDPTGLSAQLLNAKIETSGGVEIDILATDGNVDTANKVATLSGGVRLTTSTGYDIGTEQIQARLDVTNISTAGPVIATGPFGRVEAGHMQLTRSPESPNGEDYLLVFNGGVKLVYEPGK